MSGSLPEGRVANRVRLSRACLYGNVHLDDRALLDLHLLKRAEDAIFVPGGDCHSFRLEYAPLDLKRTLWC